MPNIAEKFVNTAKNYIGYDCKTFNDYFGMPSGTPWCAEFVSKCASDIGAINKLFVKTMGAGSVAREAVACGYGQWKEGHETIPEAGDIIVFTWNGLGYYPGQDKYFSDHVGIVEYVEGSTVHTVEGNANGSNTSSTVCRKSYPLYSGKINGYYHPNWALMDSSIKESSSESTAVSANSGSQAIKEVQLWHNKRFGTRCDVDGQYGPQTKAAIVGSLQSYLNSAYDSKLDVDGIMGEKTEAQCRTLSKGDSGDNVKILQSALICNGLDVNGYDGEFGDKTEESVKSFQKQNSLESDGTATQKTFYALLK